MKTKYGKRASMKQRRVFSKQVKKQIVRDIEQGKCSVTEAKRELSVCSASIYKWIYKYSRYLQKNKTLVVEDKSEIYRSKELENRVLVLEAALGRKQMEVDLLEKVITLANEEYQTDLKKNLLNRHSNGSGSVKGCNTDTK